MKLGFGNMTKKKPVEEPGKVVIPKEISDDQLRFCSSSEKELCLSVKEKLAFLSGNTEKSIDELSKRLCVKEELQKAYLNKNFKAVKEYFQKPTLTKKPVFSNVLSSKMESVQSVNEVGFEDEPVDDWEDFEVTEDDSKTNQKIKIKLVIVEISHTKKEQNIRKFLSPLASITGQSPQFGMVSELILTSSFIQR
jgi:exoribonuclease R